MPIYKGKDPCHTYRAPDAVYLPALATARKRGESVGAVIRRALVEYARPNMPANRPARPAPAPTAGRNPHRRVGE